MFQDDKIFFQNMLLNFLPCKAIFFFPKVFAFNPRLRMKKKIFQKTAFLVKRMMWVSMNLLDSQELLKGDSQAVTFGTYVSHLFLSSVACVTVS